MLFDDLFYPDNPERREEVAKLSGQIRAALQLFSQQWNTFAGLINSILAAEYPQYHLRLLSCDVDSDTLQVCVTEFKSVVSDATTKLNKLARDVGTKQGIANFSAGELHLDPTEFQKLSNALTTVADAGVSLFAMWYVARAFQILGTVVSVADVAAGTVIRVAGGILGGAIAGGVGFVVTDVIASAITGAIQRNELNEAIDALRQMKKELGDPLIEAAGHLGGISQSIRDGNYRLSDSLMIVKIGDKYKVTEL